jgi:hypothetical protein
MIKSSPIAVALLIVVIIYVRAQNKGLNTFLAVMEKRDEKLTKISDQCHSTQIETSRMTTEAIRENTRVLAQVLRILERLNGHKLS